MYSQVFEVLVATIPVFILVILGVILRKRKIVNHETDKGLTTLIINLLMPCFIFDNILGSQAASNLSNVASLATLGAGIIIASIALVYFLSPLLGLKEGHGRRSFTVASSIQNYGYLVVPLIISIYGDKELLATLFLHNLGVEIAIYTIGIMIFSGKISLHPKIFLKAPVIAVVVGVALNVSSLAPHIPSPILAAIAMIGSAAFPLALIAIGMSIGEVLPETKFTLRVGISAVATRLILLPAMILAVAYFLPVEQSTKKVLLLQAAMPAALFPIVLARHYGGKPSLVAEVILVTSIVSFITMPIVITLGRALLGV